MAQCFRDLCLNIHLLCRSSTATYSDRARIEHTIITGTILARNEIQLVRRWLGLPCRHTVRPNVAGEDSGDFATSRRLALMAAMFTPHPAKSMPSFTNTIACHNGMTQSMQNTERRHEDQLEMKVATVLKSIVTLSL